MEIFQFHIRVNIKTALVQMALRKLQTVLQNVLEHDLVCPQMISTI